MEDLYDFLEHEITDIQSRNLNTYFCLGIGTAPSYNNNEIPVKWLYQLQKNSILYNREYSKIIYLFDEKYNKISFAGDQLLDSIFDIQLKYTNCNKIKIYKNILYNIKIIVYPYNLPTEYLKDQTSNDMMYKIYKNNVYGLKETIESKPIKYRHFYDLISKLIKLSTDILINNDCIFNSKTIIVNPDTQTIIGLKHINQGQHFEYFT